MSRQNLFFFKNYKSLSFLKFQVQKIFIKNLQNLQNSIKLCSLALVLLLVAPKSYALDQIPSSSLNTDLNQEFQLASASPKSPTGYIERRHSIMADANNWSIEAYYPSIGAVLVDSEIANWVRNQVNIFEEGVRELSRNDPTHFNLQIDYKNFLTSFRCASFVFTIKTDIGNKTPDLGLMTATYLIQEGRKLYYEDLFAEPDELIKFLSAYSRRILYFRDWRYPDAVFIDFGTEPKKVNFRCFAVTDYGLSVFFPPNQVAPSYEGTIEINIPLAELMKFGPQLQYWGVKPEEN